MSTLTIRPIQPTDEEFLWVMLYYAAHMDEDGPAALDAAREDAYLKRYVQGWGLATDVGVVAWENETRVGAVWSRQLAADEDGTLLPEIAAAVLPSHIGRGLGTHLLHAYLAAAQKQFTAVTLSVRANNPALRLYQRLGFQVTGETINRVGTQSYLMRLDFL